MVKWLNGFQKNHFWIGMWNSRPPPFMEKNHLKFPFWLIEYSPYIAHKNYDASTMMSLTHYYNQILSNTNQCYQIQLDSQTLSESCQYVIACHVSPKKSIFHCNQAQTVFKRSQRSLTRLFSTNCQGWFKDFTARLRKLDMQSTKNHLGIVSAKTLKFLESGWCDLAGVEIFGPSDNRMQKASRECWIISEQQRLEYDHQNNFHCYPGQGQAL